MEEKLRQFIAKKRQFGHEIQPLIFDAWRSLTSNKKHNMFI